MVNNIELLRDPKLIQKKLKVLLEYLFCKLKEEILNHILSQLFDFDKGLNLIETQKLGNTLFPEKYHGLVGATIRNNRSISNQMR